MVYTYQRKTDQGSWNASSMRADMVNVKAGMSIRNAAITFNLPKSMLHRNVKSNNDEKHLGRFRPVLSAYIEQEVKEYLIKASV